MNSCFPKNAADLDALLQATDAAELAMAAGATHEEAVEHGRAYMQEYREWEMIHRLGVDNGPAPDKTWSKP